MSEAVKQEWRVSGNGFMTPEQMVERIRELVRENAILTDAMKKEVEKVRVLEAGVTEFLDVFDSEGVDKIDEHAYRLRQFIEGGERESGVGDAGNRESTDPGLRQSKPIAAANREEAIPPAKPAAPPSDTCGALHICGGYCVHYPHTGLHGPCSNGDSDGWGVFVKPAPPKARKER